MVKAQVRASVVCLSDAVELGVVNPVALADDVGSSRQVLDLVLGERDGYEVVADRVFDLAGQERPHDSELAEECGHRFVVQRNV
jgi:hypothetical protein